MMSFDTNECRPKADDNDTKLVNLSSPTALVILTDEPRLLALELVNKLDTTVPSVNHIELTVMSTSLMSVDMNESRPNVADNAMELVILTSQTALVILTDEPRLQLCTCNHVAQRVGHSGTGDEPYRSHHDEHVDVGVRHERGLAKGRGLPTSK